MGLPTIWYTAAPKIPVRRIATTQVVLLPDWNFAPSGWRRSPMQRDSEALIEHLANLGDLSEAILATGSVSGELLGEPSAELRANLADSPVRLFTPYLSM